MLFAGRISPWSLGFENGDLQKVSAEPAEADSVLTSIQSQFSLDTIAHIKLLNCIIFWAEQISKPWKRRAALKISI